MNWKTIDRPGHFSWKKDKIHAGFDEQYGVGNWKLTYAWGDQIIPRDMAIQLYEDSYYEFLKEDKEVLEWLITTASDVYDNNPSNVHSGLDYTIQEYGGNHLQDISIRRSLIRLGRWFEGDRLVEIRGSESEGYMLSPGVVPFHLPEMIMKPALAGWWEKDTVEDFYQSNKLLQVMK